MRISIARPLVKFGAQFGVILVLAGGLAGCETIASLDPTGLLSSDETEITPPDPNSAAAAPELANIPAAPQVPDDQRNVAGNLAAQGAQAQYSGDALRAGTEASAPVPGAAAPVSPQVATARAPSADAAPTADAPPSASPAAPISVAGNAAPMVAPAPVAPARSANPNAAVPAVPPPDSVPGRLASLTQSAPAAAPTPVARPAAAAPPPGAEPAVPAVPPDGAIRSTMMAAPVMSDGALGFRPSAAPALDPSVGNFVSAPILAHYRQTLTGGSGASASMSGANGAVIAASAAGMGGAAPTAMIYFSGDGAALSAAARTQIRAAATAFKASGGSASVRVVGHASSRTADMPVERHLEVIFQKSQQRANAVAQELIRQGVPADHLQIDAVGDSQPVYYESMPKGEEGNRRAEIFVQG